MTAPKQLKTNVQSLTEVERQILSYLYGRFDRQAKPKIRRAWETGDYSGLHLRDDGVTALQYLRNKIGPTGLHYLSLREC